MERTPFGQGTRRRQLKETQKRAVLVRQARAGMPLNTGGYAGRVAAVRARMDQLQQRLADVSEQAESDSCSLSPSASSKRQKQRIETYQIQARYELAAIYDRTSNATSRRRSHEARRLAAKLDRRFAADLRLALARRSRVGGTAAAMRAQEARRPSRISRASRSTSAPIRRRMWIPPRPWTATSAFST